MLKKLKAEAYLGCSETSNVDHIVSVKFIKLYKKHKKFNDEGSEVKAFPDQC